MRKGLCACALALLLLCPLRATALEGMASFGGGGTDRLLEAAACEGGLFAVGYTTSADGSLSFRERTGKAGWAARVGADGRLLWSVCTAHAGRDEMISPYAHTDGTFSAVLRGQTTGQEWLRISERGRVTARVTVPQADALCAHTDKACAMRAIPYENEDGEAMLAVIVGHGDGNWCLPAISEAGEVFPGAVYPEPRDMVRVLVRGGDGLLAEITTSEAGEASVYWLRPGDAQGLTVTPVPLEEGKLTTALDAISFDDGSVLFSAQRADAFGMLFRVSCTGEIIYTVDLDDNAMALAETAEGFAALDSDDVLFFDEDGHLLGQRAVGVEAMTAASAMERMDGGVVLLENEFTGAVGDTTLLFVERYTPLTAGEYDEALYARPVSEVLAAQAQGGVVALLLRETGGGERVVLVDEAGREAETDNGPHAAPEDGLALVDGALCWAETDGGSLVTRLDANGGVRWQTRIPIHTAADRLQWCCAAQMQDGGFLLGGRYLSGVETISDWDEAFLQRSPDGLRCEAVIAQLSASGVLRKIQTVENLGGIFAVLPAQGARETMLLGARGDVTTSGVCIAATPDGERWAVLPIELRPEGVFLLPAADGGVLAVGTSRVSGRSSAIIERVPE